LVWRRLCLIGQSPLRELLMATLKLNLFWFKNNKYIINTLFYFVEHNVIGEIRKEELKE
jgi:hypothetical protein